MILKLLCVEQFRIEDMLQRSYVERSSLRLVVSRKQQITELNAKIDAFPDADCSNCLIPGPDYTRASIDELFYDLQSYFNLASKIWETSMVVLLQKHLVKGRLILVNYPPLGLTGRLAVVLNV
jgi:superfamily II RNA helicase